MGSRAWCESFILGALKKRGQIGCLAGRVQAVVVARRLPGVHVAPSDILNRMENRSFSDVGGTPGGLGHFLLGFFMTCIGGFLIANQVKVVGSYWSFYGANSFGITLLPMLFGIGIVFWNGRSIIGWVLTIAGALFIFAGVIANMHIFFAPASLFETMVMLVLLVGGLGLIARAIVPHPTKSSS